MVFFVWVFFFIFFLFCGVFLALCFDSLPAAQPYSLSSATRAILAGDKGWSVSSPVPRGWPLAIGKYHGAASSASRLMGQGCAAPAQARLEGPAGGVVAKYIWWRGAGVQLFLLFLNFRSVSVPEVAQSWQAMLRWL